MPTSETFVAYSLVIRIFSGVGAAATSTASLTLLSQTFKDNIASAMVSKNHSQKCFTSHFWNGFDTKFIFENFNFL